MPTYRVKCESCGEVSEIYRKLADYENLPEHCGVRTIRLIGAPAVHADISPYVSPASGKVINSRSSQSEDLRRTNSILNEPGLNRDISRWKSETAEKAFTPIANGVDEAVKRLVATNQLES